MVLYIEIYVASLSVVFIISVVYLVYLRYLYRKRRGERMKVKELDYNNYVTCLSNPAEMVKHPILWLKYTIKLTIDIVIAIYLSGYFIKFMR